MKQIAINYGKVLFLLGIDRQDIKQTEEIWNGSEPLREARKYFRRRCSRF